MFEPAGGQHRVDAGGGDRRHVVGGEVAGVAYYSSAGSLIDGSPYRNSYLSLVTVRRGKIEHWIEFCDPAPLEHAAALLQAPPPSSDVPR